MLASLPLYEGVLNVFQCIFLFVLLQKVFLIDPFVAVQHLNQNLIFCVCFASVEPEVVPSCGVQETMLLNM